MVVSRKQARLLFILYVNIFFFAVFMQKGKKNISSENIDALLNIVPIRSTVNDISYLMHNGLIGNMNLINNTIGNVVLFIPLPFFLIRIFNCIKLFNILLIALLLSLWVEVMQYVFILGVSDIDDVLLNVLGTYLGYVLLTHVFKIKA